MNPLSHNAALQDRWEKEMPLQETLYNLSDVLSGAVHTYRSVLSNLSEVCAPTLSSGSSSGSDESTASIECFRAGSSGSDESTASIECCRAGDSKGVPDGSPAQPGPSGQPADPGSDNSSLPWTDAPQKLTYKFA
jgi:hypothetical protein